MMEVYNVISNIPSLLIVIVLTYSIGAGFWNLIFAMSVTTWIGIAYSIRIQIMRYRDLEYNLASRTLGTPTFKIVVKTLCHNWYLLSLRRHLKCFQPLSHTKLSFHSLDLDCRLQFQV